MFSVQYLAREYSGNASTTTGYTIDFPYLEASDINVSVMAQGTGTVAVAAGAATFSSAQTTLEVGHKVRISGVLYEVDTRTSDTVFSFTTRATIASTAFHLPASAAVLTEGQFTVVTSGAGAPYVTTAAAYPATSIVRVYAMRPLNQQFDLPEGGALPVAEIERALDHVVMLILQTRLEAGLSGSVVSGPASGVKDLVVVSDATVRAGTAPRFQGQICVQVSDWSLWIGETTATGDWVQFAPTSVGAMANRLVFLATADAGTPGDRQNAVISRAYEWAVNGIICAGDNHYAPATFEQAWAAFSAFIADQKVDRALGNHDEDDWTADNTKFGYLPANPNGHRRYYKRSHGNGLLDIFVLHSGRDSSWNAIEPDGNYPGSAQHAWFVAQLAASTARWKIVVMHHPPVTASVEANRADVNLDWPEFAQVDGVFVGHVHFSEWLTCRGTPIVNVSGGVARGGDVSDLLNLTGVDAIGSNLLWHDDRRGLLSKLTITPTRFLVSYHKIMTGELVYQRDLGDKTAHRSEWGREVVGPGSLVPENTVLVGICPVPLCRGAWVISVAIPGNAALVGNVLVDGAVAGEWSLAAGEFWVEVDSLRNLRRGARVQVQITSNAAYGAWYGLSVEYKGQMVG